jgi:hypothetical protein
MKLIIILTILIGLLWSNNSIINRYPFEQYPLSSFFFAIGSIIFYSFVFLLVSFTKKKILIFLSILHFFFFSFSYKIDNGEIILFLIMTFISLLPIPFIKKTKEIPSCIIAIYLICLIVWFSITNFL